MWSARDPDGRMDLKRCRHDAHSRMREDPASPSVNASVSKALRRLGFVQCRVRHHGDVARLEIAREELDKAFTLQMFDALSRELKSIGFRFVAIDVDGYRTGALNEVLTQIESAQ